MVSTRSSTARSDARYMYTERTNFHKERGRYLLKHYPEVRKIMKPYPLSMVYIVLIAGLQLAIAAVVQQAPWWVMVAVAFLVGAVASHALFVLLHDAIHQLVFHNKTVSKCIAIFISIGQGVPSGVSFGEFHMAHHMYMGEYDKDPDIPLEGEGRIVQNRAPLKMMWLYGMGFIQALRPMGRAMKTVSRWALVNLIVVAVTDLLIGYFVGWQALLYLLLSTVFGLGAHPLSARWIQEHFVFRKGQETYSYYGLGNVFAFNVGYHNEHHDLIGIPWIYLPRLKKTAPELYEPLYAHTSWSRLYLRFIFDKKASVFNRLVKAA